jgi:rhodanese-related sulfurtransferase
MNVKRVSPDEALSLVDREGWSYVDVRSVPEFESGHPEGAYNVPIAHLGPMGMSPNPEFLGVMEKAFPKDSKLVIGCKSGGRSLQASGMLLAAGFQNVVDQRAGFQGGMDHSGRPEAGWGPKGLPTSRAAEPGRSWADLKGGK